MHANSWQFFTKKSVMKIGASSATAYYVITVLMSNITNCLQGNQTSKKLQYVSSTLEKYLRIEVDEDKIDETGIDQVKVDDGSSKSDQDIFN